MTQASSCLFRWLALFTVLCGLHAPFAHAAATVDRLMDVSGLRHALEQLPAVIVSSLDAPQPGADIPAQVRVAMKEAATQAFRARPLLTGAHEHLGRSLSERQISDAVSFYETLLGRRITDLERKAAEPAGMQAFEAYVRDMARHPPSEGRRRLIEAYDAATGSSEAVVAIMESTALAVALGLNASQPRQSQVSDQVLQRRLKEALPQFQMQARAHVTASLLFTYRTLGDRELDDYVRFLQAPSGSAYARAAAQAFQQVIAEAMSRFMQAMPKALERVKGSART